MGFEVVVRPVVLPNIRPASARQLPSQDDPDKGFAEIKGNGATEVNLSRSYSSSASTNQQQETERRVDEVRVHQQEADGTVNRSNFVDIQVANKIKMSSPEGQKVYYYTPVATKSGNIELLRKNFTIINPT